MSESQPVSAAPGRWKRPAYVILSLAAIVLVMLAWFHTPEAQMRSDDGGYTTIRCANAGPSRWEPPTVSEGQELSNDPNMSTFNQQVLKNDIESLSMQMTCDSARDGHTDNLIVATFVAGSVFFFGYLALWRRRPGTGQSA